MKMTQKLSKALGGVAIAAGLVACGGGGGGGGVVNQVPVAATLQNQVVLAGSAFSFTVPAYTDGNGDALTYTATKGDGNALPTGLTFTAATRTFAGTSALDVSTPLTVKVTATDPSSTSASATFTLSSVAPGVFKYDDQDAGSLFYGIVFPASAGVAEVWTWEYLEQNYTKLYKSQLNIPAANSFATTAANRRTSDNSAKFTHDTSVVTTVSRGAVVGNQNFNVGGTARYGTAEQVAWLANADFSMSDWLGRWVIQEKGTTITHVWDVAADGSITGSRKNGSTTICTVDTSAGASVVTLLSSPVSRIKVTENCGTVQAPDLQVLEGISFVASKNGDQVTNRVLLLNGSGGTTVIDKFVTNIACRDGSAKCTAP